VLTPLLLLLAGIGVLYLGAEGLIRGAARMGVAWGVAPILVGLTVVSIGTSAPELVVSLLAAARGSPDLALGNILGSNLANVGLVLALAALVRPLEVVPSVVRRDLPWMVVITLLAFPLLLNLRVGRVEGTVLALLLFAYLAVLYRSWQGDLASAPAKAASDPTFRPLREAAKVGAGAVGLVVGGQLIVLGATDLAAQVGVPELLVGLTVVAVGTSLPELATTVVAAVRRETDLAVGNIVGSNIFNLTFVLGGAALVHPLSVAERILTLEYPAMALLSLLLVPIVLIGPRRPRRQPGPGRVRVNGPKRIRSVGRVEGLLLLLAYLGVWFWLV